MAEENAKSHNPFSKIAGDLRTSKEALIKKNEQEYDDRLEQAEEILIGDCHDALAGITAQAYMKSGQVSFESEAFLWFKGDKKTLRGESDPDPSIEVTKAIAAAIKRRSKSLASQASEKPDKTRFIGPKQIAFANSELYDIYRKVRNQLSEENFVLETNDGIEFTLLWSLN